MGQLDFFDYQLWDDQTLIGNKLWDDQTLIDHKLWDDQTLMDHKLWDDQTLIDHKLWDDQTLVERVNFTQSNRELENSILALYVTDQEDGVEPTTLSTRVE